MFLDGHLAQFTNYRQEWRNPSTHDYTLDFDEDEALIAFVSVTVFAIVLCDQIGGKLAYDASAAVPSGGTSDVERLQPLLDLVSGKVLLFAGSDSVSGQEADLATQPGMRSYLRFQGALEGFLSSELADIPEIQVTQDAVVGDRFRVDILVEKGNEKIVVEVQAILLKFRLPDVTDIAVQRALAKLELYLGEAEVLGGVLLVYLGSTNPYQISSPDGNMSETIRVIAQRTVAIPI